jgi:RNA polymerase sigma factor (sigma-70 family)
MPRLPLNLPRSTGPHEARSDKQLISSCLAGDQRAWEALIDRYVALIYSTCRRTGLSGTDCEDVVQDVCVILLERLAQVRDEAKLSSWLISTASREAWRFQKRKGLKLASELGEEDWAFESGVPLHGTSDESPEATILALEEQQMVRLGMANLNVRCRTLLTRLYGTEEPASYTEIAAELSLPVGSIGPTRARCLQQLRKLLSGMGY